MGADNWEDGSTDGTREICVGIANENPNRVRLILNEAESRIYIDGKPTGRRNVIELYRQARGRYVAVCEGDDRWDSTDKLRKQLELMESDPSISGCYHDTRVIDECGKLLRNFRDELPTTFSTNSIVALRAGFHTSSFMFRNNRQFEIVPDWYYTVWSFDMLVFNRILQDGLFRKIEGLWSSYRIHSGGITSSIHFKGPGIHFHRIILWLRSIENYEGYSQEIVYSKIVDHFGVIVSLVGRLDGVKWLLKVIWERPWRLFVKPVLFLRMIKRLILV